MNYIITKETICKKIEFLEFCTDELEKDDCIFFWGNFDPNGCTEEVMRECEAYGVNWDDILATQVELGRREQRYFAEHPHVREDMFDVVCNFTAEYNTGKDVVAEFSRVMQARCGISPETMLIFELASRFLFAGGITIPDGPGIVMPAGGR